MTLKARLLRLPLDVQIFFSLMIIIVLVATLIIFISEEFTSVHIRYMLSTKKEYYYRMQQNIIESNIFFMNLCLLQYENLIKLFNYQFYNYLNDKYALDTFTNNNPNVLDNSSFYLLFDNNISNFDPSRMKKNSIYIYSFSKFNDSILNKINLFVKANFFSYLNDEKSTINFRIPYLGNISLIGEYVITFPAYGLFFSINGSKIKQFYQYTSGNFYIYKDLINEKREINYNFYKKYFEDFNNKKILFMDIMFKLRFSIFENYSKINNTNDKEEYIRRQSIYFQNIYYQNDSTWFYDNWNSKNSRFFGTNNLVHNYLDFILFHLSSKIDIVSVPFQYDTNNVISKNLCYFFLMKQIIFMNITSEKKIDEFNSDFLDNIYNTIFNKEKINITDCQLRKYYSSQMGNQIRININFNNYYDLHYTYQEYMFQLIDKDMFSNIFTILYSYPNYLCLKEFSPNFFSIEQLNFLSYSFSREISIMIDSSKHFLNNVKYLMILLLLYIWLILFFILIIISQHIIREVTEPIMRLTDIINLNNINDINQNEDIFEYKLDEEINEFFLLCKKLINGEIRDNNLNVQTKVNSDKNNNKNNNMIINNKMILELIESQKSLNKDDKEIYLLKQIYSSNTSNNARKRHKTNKSSKYNNKDKNSRGLNLIQLNSIKYSDNKLTNYSEDMYSEINENDPEVVNMKFYENLLNLTNYVYNGKNKINQNQNKMRMNINHTSTNRLIKLKSEDYTSKEKNDENKNIRKDSKYITYYWYANAKKNKLFEN